MTRTNLDMSRVKDNRRDRHFLSLRIHKVRFPLARVIGKRAWPDGAILDLIEKKMEYQLTSAERVKAFRQGVKKQNQSYDSFGSL